MYALVCPVNTLPCTPAKMKNGFPRPMRDQSTSSSFQKRDVCRDRFKTLFMDGCNGAYVINTTPRQLAIGVNNRRPSTTILLPAFFDMRIASWAAEAINISSKTRNYVIQMSQKRILLVSEPRTNPPRWFLKMDSHCTSNRRLVTRWPTTWAQIQAWLVDGNVRAPNILTLCIPTNVLVNRLSVHIFI